MKQWKVVVPWPAVNKFVLQADLKNHPDVEPTVQGAGGAQYYVTVYLAADAAADRGEARERAIQRLTEILGETEPRDDQIPVASIEATLIQPRTGQTKTLAIESDPPIEVDEVPLSSESDH